MSNLITTHEIISYTNIYIDVLDYLNQSVLDMFLTIFLYSIFLN